MPVTSPVLVRRSERLMSLVEGRILATSREPASRRSPLQERSSEVMVELRRTRSARSRPSRGQSRQRESLIVSESQSRRGLSTALAMVRPPSIVLAVCWTVPGAVASAFRSEQIGLVWDGSESAAQDTATEKRIAIKRTSLGSRSELMVCGPGDGLPPWRRGAARLRLMTVLEKRRCVSGSITS
eukprot:1878495-Prymnesium_polylepis.1